MSLSSTEAEYIALGTITQELLFQRQILNKLLNKGYNKTNIIYEDNLGAIYLTRNHQISQRTKHIDAKHHFIRNLVETKIINIKYIKSENNIADIFTKNVKEETFNKQAKAINNGKVKCDGKDKDKINDVNNETKEYQDKETKR